MCLQVQEVYDVRWFELARWGSTSTPAPTVVLWRGLPHYAVWQTQLHIGPGMARDTCTTIVVSWRLYTLIMVCICPWQHKIQIQWKTKNALMLEWQGLDDVWELKRIVHDTYMTINIHVCHGYFRGNRRERCFFESSQKNNITETRSTQRAQTSLAEADHYSDIAHCKNIEPWWWKTTPLPPQKKIK